MVKGSIIFTLNVQYHRCQASLYAARLSLNTGSLLRPPYGHGLLPGQAGCDVNVQCCCLHVKE